jgi:hypothetical protein
LFVQQDQLTAPIVLSQVIVLIAVSLAVSAPALRIARARPGVALRAE